MSGFMGHTHTLGRSKKQTTDDTDSTDKKKQTGFLDFFIRVIRAISGSIRQPCEAASGGCSPCRNGAKELVCGRIIPEGVEK
jgi:hypothetical protein